MNSFLKNIRILILLIVSLLLYFIYDFKLFFILLFISFFSFFISNLIILINNSSVINNKIISKVLLIISIILLLSILISYKYVKLFTPLGMSFFLYKAISFLIDSYDGKVDYDVNILTYVLYISYFPQILAGPIEKPKIFFDRVNEIYKVKLLDINRISDGFLILLYGIFIKLVLVDRLCLPVDNIFNHYYDYGTIELFFGQVLFTLQLYFDFLSYSYIVIGVSKILTLESSENFNAPLFSSSVKEFWRRWHISLSTWFKDYVYIKLGGNRCSKFRNGINLLVTFVASGIWHGTNITFIVWGALNGIYQILFNNFKKFKIDIFNKIITFILISFSFIFFRSDDIYKGLVYIKRLFTRFNPWVLLNLDYKFLNLTYIDILLILISLFIVLFFDYKKYLDKDFYNNVFSKKILVKTFFILLLFSIVLIYGKYGTAYDKTAFIYGGF